jgi:hypothetical protein
MIYSANFYHIQDYQYQTQSYSWAASFHIWLNSPPTHPLNPVNPDNACTLRITAAAGTELAGAYSQGTFNWS